LLSSAALAGENKMIAIIKRKSDKEKKNTGEPKKLRTASFKNFAQNLKSEIFRSSYHALFLKGLRLNIRDDFGL
jgi:hypothetical protein